MTSLTTPTFAAEGLLHRLKANGIDYLFANGGTDFAPVIEGYANGIAKEVPMPTPLVIPHETAAMGMAHGYYLATGKPQAVMVHVNVGLANCVMGVVNAAQENAPVLVMSGRTPLTEFSRVGSRMTPVQYAQEMRDQASMVRELVKWDYELRYGDQVDVLIDRATTIAMSEPRGPVYLSLPREPLAEPVGPDWTPGRPVQAVPAQPAPDRAAIRAAAELLARAKNPLIICQRGDVAGALSAPLGDFASKFAIPVCEFWTVRNVLATDHPMQAGYDVAPLLPEADVVVVLDSPVPWIQRSMKPMAGAKVIHIGSDPLFTRWPVRSFQTDMAITATPVAAVQALAEEMSRLAPDTAARYKAVAAQNQARREAARKKAMTVNGSAITPPYVGHCVSEAMDERAVYLSELGAPVESIRVRAPNRYINTPFSGGLGWAVPASLGASLADRDRLVICCTGDGSYMFANPVACHQIAEAHRLPVLFIVMNNGVWNAVRRAALAMYPQGQAAGIDAANKAMPITSLEPTPDFAQVAAASRAWSRSVENAADLPGAIAQAIEVIRKEKRQALLNVRVAYRGEGR